MIAIFKTKHEEFPIAIDTVDCRYLGVNEMGDHYHEINTRVPLHKIHAISQRHPHIIDYAFDIETQFQFFKAMYQELNNSALTT